MNKKWGYYKKNYASSTFILYQRRWLSFCDFILLLQNLLLGHSPYDIISIMHDVGMILSNIKAYEFSEVGFLDKYLNIIPHSTIYANLLIYTK